MKNHYFSHSKKAHIPVGEMAYPHLTNAFNKLRERCYQAGMEEDEFDSLVAVAGEIAKRDAANAPPPEEDDDDRF